MKLIQNAVFSYSNKIVILFFQMSILVFFDVENYAEFMVSLGVAEIASSFLTLGMHSAILRENSKLLQQRYVSLFLLIICLSTCIYSIVHFFVGDTLFVFAILAFSISLTKFFRNLLISMREIDTLNISFGVQASVLALYLFFLIPEVWSIEVVCFVFATSQVLSLLSAIIFNPHIVQRSFVKKVEINTIKLDIGAFFLRDFIGLVSSYFGRIILFYTGLVAASAAFTLATTVHSYLLQSLIPFNQVVRPKLRDLFDAKQYTEFLAVFFLYRTSTAALGILAVSGYLIVLFHFFDLLDGLASLPGNFLFFTSIVSIATLISFQADAFGTWTMLKFAGSRKYLVTSAMVFSLVNIVFQAIGFVVLQDTGILLAFSISTVVNIMIVRFYFNAALERCKVK